MERVRSFDWWRGADLLIGGAENLQANPHGAGEPAAIVLHGRVYLGRAIVPTAVQAFGHFGRDRAGSLAVGRGVRQAPLC